MEIKPLTMQVSGLEVSTKRKENVTYISLTDIAKRKNPEHPAEVIAHWMSNKNSFDYYSLWEELFNPDFNIAESRNIRIDEVGLNAFLMTPAQWKRRTNAIGIIPSAGKYSIGTFAHPDIAMEFASWIDTPFKLYLVKEFQRLKAKENEQLVWTARRELSKINYRLQTDAVKQNIVPKLQPEQITFAYTDEADRLNVALFGMTASEWRKEHKAEAKKGENIRDYASHPELLLLANMESYNAEMIRDGISAKDRTVKLNDMARYQLPLLIDTNSPLLIENNK